jgi:DNA-binding SARP family transcriptional activator
MELRILGPLEALDGDRPVPLGGKKPRTLLALLILRRGDVVSIDEIVEALWGEAAPKTAEHSVQVYVSDLRKALGEGAEIATHPGGYSLPISGSLDVDRFVGLAERGRAVAASGGAQDAAAVFREALALWRGSPLPEFAYEDFARPEIDRLEELHLATLEERIEADLAIGRHADVIAELRSLVDLHPFRERLRAALMLALYRSGRQSEALQEFHRARTLLADELGIDPTSALVELNAAILDQDPALELHISERARPRANVEDGEPTTPPNASPSRKIVSVLYLELVVDGAADADPEASASVGGRGIEVARAILDARGATTFRRDDGLVAAFGHPLVHEDDALRAVHAGVELRARLRALNEELGAERLAPLVVRIGVHTGEVLTDAPGDLEGLDAGAIRRARSLAAGSTVDDPVIDEPTFELVRAAVEVEPARDGLHRVIEVRPGVRGVARRIDSPIVGRDDELAELDRAFERVRTRGRCELLTVHGDAGIGKTRLVDEFIRRASSRARVLEGRCLAYGEGITYWPIAEAVRTTADITDADDAAAARDKLGALLPDGHDSERIAGAIAQILGFAGAAPAPGESLWAIRRLLESLAADSPVVLSIEDVHWAEPTLLELIEGLADWLRDSPLLLLCTTRPDIFERRPGWGGGRSNATIIGLNPLSTDETGLLIENLVQHPGLDADAKAKITEAAEGNPLFVEQLLSMLIDEGLLTRSGGSWTLAADLSSIALPTSLQTLLTARLDALTPPERQVLGVASVVGRTFDVQTVEALGSHTNADDVATSIAQLVRKDLVRPARTPDGEGFRFRHVLIMNATYETLPKRARAAMHERVADRMQDMAGAQSAAYDEIVGDHLARAAGYLEEIGPRDEHLAELRQQAGSHLAVAGSRAFARGDMPAAVTLHGRAVDLLADDAPERLAILPELGQAFVEVGPASEADRVFDEAIALGTERGDLHAVADALLFRFESELWRGLFDRVRVSETLARELIERHPNDGFVQQRCWSILGIWAPTWAEADASTQRAMDFAEQIGDAKGRNENFQMMSGLLASGPGSAEEGLAISEDFLARAAGDPVTEAAIVVNARVQLLGMTGRMQDGRREYERARQTFRNLGLPLWLGASGTIGPASTENAFGDPAIAESLTREGIDVLERLGDAQSWLVQVLLIHAHSLAAQDRAEEAAAMLPRIISIRHPFHDADVSLLRGQIALVSGRPDEAVAELRAALDGIHEDWYLSRGPLTLLLAEALHASGDIEAARARAKDALGIFERKGDTVSPARAMALL